MKVTSIKRSFEGCLIISMGLSSSSSPSILLYLCIFIIFSSDYLNLLSFANCASWMLMGLHLLLTVCYRLLYLYIFVLFLCTFLHFHPMRQNVKNQCCTFSESLKYCSYFIQTMLIYGMHLFSLHNTIRHCANSTTSDVM